MSDKCYHDRPLLLWQRNLRQIGYNSNHEVGVMRYVIIRISSYIYFELGLNLKTLQFRVGYEQRSSMKTVCSRKFAIARI